MPIWSHRDTISATRGLRWLRKPLYPNQVQSRTSLRIGGCTSRSLSFGGWPGEAFRVRPHDGLNSAASTPGYTGQRPEPTSSLLRDPASLAGDAGTAGSAMRGVLSDLARLHGSAHLQVRVTDTCDFAIPAVDRGSRTHRYPSEALR